MTKTKMAKWKPAQPAGSVANIKHMLDAKEGEIAQLIPKHVGVERFNRAALVALNTNPRILECSGLSIFVSILNAAKVGLVIGGATPQAHLVKFKKTCQLIIDYRGFAHLARQAGVSRIEAATVYEKDRFEFVRGTELKLSHQRHLGTSRGKKLGAYALLILPDGTPMADFMDTNELESVAKRSMSYQAGGGPWKSDRKEMEKKTVLRRLLKLAPMSPDRQEAAQRLDAAITIDNDDYEELDFDAAKDVTAPVTQQQEETKASAMARNLKKNRAEDPETKDAADAATEKDLAPEPEEKAKDKKAAPKSTVPEPWDEYAEEVYRAVWRKAESEGSSPNQMIRDFDTQLQEVFGVSEIEALNHNEENYQLFASWLSNSWRIKVR